MQLLQRNKNLRKPWLLGWSQAKHSCCRKIKIHKQIQENGPTVKQNPPKCQTQLFQKNLNLKESVVTNYAFLKFKNKFCTIRKQIQENELIWICFLFVKRLLPYNGGGRKYVSGSFVLQVLDSILK